jgi:hypothetical protein
VLGRRQSTIRSRPSTDRGSVRMPLPAWAGGGSSRIVIIAPDNPVCHRMRSRDKGRRNIQYEEACYEL